MKTMRQYWVCVLTLITFGIPPLQSLVTAEILPRIPRSNAFYSKEAISPAQLSPSMRFSPYSSIVLAFNATGVIWSTLDEFVAHPEQVLAAANWTGEQVISHLDQDALGVLSAIRNINGSDIMRSLDVSGLGFSVLRGLLLDETIRSALTDITYRVVESNLDVILFVLHNFLRPVAQGSQRGVLEIGVDALTLTSQRTNGIGTRHMSIFQKASTSFPKTTHTSRNSFSKPTRVSSNTKPARVRSSSALLYNVTPPILKPEQNGPTLHTLIDFLILMAGTVIDSQFFSQLVLDSFRALNDTGVLVYTIKRFITNELYVNLVGEFCTDVVKTGALRAIGNLEINLTPVISVIVAQTDLAPQLIGAMLNGSTSSLGKFSDALGQIVNDLETRGLFVDLNNAIFSSPTKEDEHLDRDNHEGQANTKDGKKSKKKLGLAAKIYDPWMFRGLIASQAMILGFNVLSS